MADDTREDNKQSGKTSPKSIRTRAFRMSFEMIAVFGVPAAVALVVGRWLDEPAGFAPLEYVLLVLAFLLSWLIVFWRVKHFTDDMESETDKPEGNGYDR